MTSEIFKYDKNMDGDEVSYYTPKDCVRLVNGKILTYFVNEYSTLVGADTKGHPIFKNGFGTLIGVTKCCGDVARFDAEMPGVACCRNCWSECDPRLAEVYQDYEVIGIKR
jgi:hypothetical protein